MRAAFDRQAAAYDDAADAQREIAARLATRLAARVPAPNSVLEIGCGTGLLSTHLARLYPGADLLVTDFSEPMLTICRARLGPLARYAVLDANAPPPLAQKFDLIASSLALQWCTDLKASLETLGSFLTPTGRLVFTTLGPENFHEWRAACAAAAIPCGLHSYPDPAAIPAAIEGEFLRLRYPSARHFLHALKSIGAATPAPGHAQVRPGRFRAFLENYRPDFAITYHVLYAERGPKFRDSETQMPDRPRAPTMPPPSRSGT